jgi:hypothetical protein
LTFFPSTAVTTQTIKIFGNGANQPQTSRERRKKGLDGAHSIKAGFIKANKKLIIEKKSVNWFGGKKCFSYRHSAAPQRFLHVYARGPVAPIQANDGSIKYQSAPHRDQDQYSRFIEKNPLATLARGGLRFHPKSKVEIKFDSRQWTVRERVRKRKASDDLLHCRARGGGEKRATTRSEKEKQPFAIGNLPHFDIHCLSWELFVFVNEKEVEEENCMHVHRATPQSHITDVEKASAK